MPKSLLTWNTAEDHGIVYAVTEIQLNRKQANEIAHVLGVNPDLLAYAHIQGNKATLFRGVEGETK